MLPADLPALLCMPVGSILSSCTLQRKWCSYMQSSRARLSGPEGQSVRRLGAVRCRQGNSGAAACSVSGSGTRGPRVKNHQMLKSLNRTWWPAPKRHAPSTVSRAQAESRMLRDQEGE